MGFQLFGAADKGRKGQRRHHYEMSAETSEVVEDILFEDQDLHCDVQETDVRTAYQFRLIQRCKTYCLLLLALLLLLTPFSDVLDYLTFF